MSNSLSSLRKVAEYFMVTEHTVTAIWRDREGCPALKQAPYDANAIAQWFSENVAGKQLVPPPEVEKFKAETEKLNRKTVRSGCLLPRPWHRQSQEYQVRFATG